MWLNISLLILLFLDVYHYQGYLLTLTHLPSKYLVILSLLLSFVFAKKGRKTLYLFGLIIFLGYVSAITLEGVTHQGYVFELIHLRPESMFLFLLPTLFFLHSRNVNNKLHLLIGLSMIYYFLRLTPIVTVQLTSSLREIVRAPFASYDHKMRLNWGGFYDFTKLVNQVTPKNAIIAIPPRSSDHPLIGNSSFFWYFVYPRTLSSLPLNVTDFGIATYTVINGSDPVWPDVPFQAKHIWLYRDGQNPLKLDDYHYDPADPIFAKVTGIAELEVMP